MEKKTEINIREFIIILILVFLACCKNEQKSTDQISNLDSLETAVDTLDEKLEFIQFSDQELESFLDSIGKLPEQRLFDEVVFRSDSIFNNQIQLDTTITTLDLEKLKQGCIKGYLDINSARKIFGNIQIDSTYLKDGTIPVTYISFDKNKSDFNEFAISPGYSDLERSCVLYFFKKNKLIAKHFIYHRYGLEVKHYQDQDGRTVIYYKENYQSGTGIWWYNFYFYKYYENKLIPILNELENVNLQYNWSVRALWFESTIQKTNPLTMKLVYYQAFSDSAENPRYIDDSTFIVYKWNEETKTLSGNYNKQKINKAQIATYYLEENELLFINAYNGLLKNNLTDKNFRKSTLIYLNEIKNYYFRKQNK